MSNQQEAIKKRKTTSASTFNDTNQQEAIQLGIAAHLAVELPILRQQCLEQVNNRLASQDATLQRLGLTTPFVDAVDEEDEEDDDDHNALPLNPLDGRIHVSMTPQQLRTIRLRNANVQQLHARISHLEAAVLAIQATSTTAPVPPPPPHHQFGIGQSQAFLPHPPPNPALIVPPWPSTQPGPSTLSSTTPSIDSVAAEAAAAAAEALRRKHKKGKAKSSTPLPEGSVLEGSPVASGRKKGGGGLKPNIHLQEAFRLQVRMEAGVPVGPLPGALEPGEAIPRHPITEAEQAAWDAIPATQKEGQTLQGQPKLRFDWSLHRDDPRAVDFVRSRVESIYAHPHKHGLTPDHLPPLDEGIEACFVTFKRIGRTTRLAKQASGSAQQQSA